MPAVLGAVIGAALGALVWAGVATATGLEIGWVAWGVGGAIGLGAALGGGRGPVTGGVCAALSLVAILAGKMLTADVIVKREIRQAAGLLASEETYARGMAQARAFAEVDGDPDAYADFVNEHGLGLVDLDDEMADLALQGFTTEVAPELRRLARESPTYAEWRGALEDEMVRLWEQEGSSLEVVRESLGAFDVVFALLGLVTAWQVGLRGIPGRPGTDRAPVGAAPRPPYPGAKPNPYAGPPRPAAPTAGPFATPPPVSREPVTAAAAPPARQPLPPRSIPRLGQRPPPDAAPPAA
jgi:hypothetical protein